MGFGFVRGADGDPGLLGAGIMSSFGETNHAWSLKGALRPFVLEEVMDTPFRTDVIQTEYFLVEDVVELRRDLDRWFATFNLSGRV